MSNDKWSQTKRIAYSKPDPFAVPVIYDKNRASPWLPADLYQRETLHYSAQILEEIMFQIDDEYKRREISGHGQWKIYKSALDDYITFTPNMAGTNLLTLPVKWFPQIVKDIQARIDVLIADNRVPDTRGHYLARIFQNYTTANPAGSYFSTYSALPETILVPGSSIAPKQRARDGDWPFDPKYVDSAVSFIGIDASGVLHAKSGPKGIETSATGWPESTISKKISGKVAGIANVKMSAANRPTINTINAANGTLGVGAGKIDTDQGYGYFSHPALVVQQLRYQPPVVEWWPATVPFRHYVRAVYSNTTPNLPYYFGQPIEKVWTENWGNWVMFGHVGINNEGFDMTAIDPGQFPANDSGNIIRFMNAVHLNTNHDPMAQEQGRSQCPYNVFRPGPGSNCRCLASVLSGIIWWAFEYPAFEWDSMSLWQLPGRGSAKYFGSKTRFRITLKISDQGQDFAIGIKTSKMGVMDKAWTWVVQVPNVDDYPSGGYVQLDFNLMSKINEREPGGYSYSADSIDALMAVYIYSKYEVQNAWFCPAVDGNGGSYIPASCMTDRCVVADTDILVGPIELYEPDIT